MSEPRRLEHEVIPRVVTKALVPMILIFALYVQFHGDFGPGGGFQAGVIFAAGLILYALVFGLDNLQRIWPSRWVEIGAACGVLIFAGTGVWTMLAGGNFLQYGVLDHHDPVHGQHLGLLLIELGVGVTVACTLTAIFYALAALPRPEEPGGADR